MSVLTSEDSSAPRLDVGSPLEPSRIGINSRVGAPRRRRWRD